MGVSHQDRKLMLSTYGDLSSVAETLDEVVEVEQNLEAKKRRKSSRYSLERIPKFIEQGEREKLALWRKAAFGFGNFSRYTVIGIQAFFLNVFLLEVAGLSTFWSGTILLIKQIYDGVTDPLVGGLSDSLHTRWGRRKPWILLASIPAGIFWVLSWYTPDFITSSGGLVVYFIIVLLAFSTMNTFVSVPYNAMVPDVAVDYDDRTAVVLFQEVFGLSSVIIFSYFQAEAVEFFRQEDNPDLIDYKKGYLVASFVTVFSVVLPMLVAISFVKEQKPKPNPEGIAANAIGRILAWFKNFFVNLFQALLFKEFFLIVVVFVLSMTAAYLFINNFVLYIKYVLKAEEQTAYMMLTLQASCTLSIFFWAFMSRQIGKKLTFFVGSVLWIGGTLPIMFVNENDITVFYCLCVVRAIGSGVGFLIPLAILPDVIELDRLKNGKAREGILYSLMILIQKTGVGLALTGSNYVLGFAGYEPTSSENTVQAEDRYQPQEVLNTFRLLMTITPVVCVALALVAISFINVTKETLDELEASLDEHDVSFRPIAPPTKQKIDSASNF